MQRSDGGTVVSPNYDVLAVARVRSPPMKGTKKSAKTATAKASKSFTAEERAAMKARAEELEAPEKMDGEDAVLARIAELKGADRAMAERLHAIIKTAAPTLSPRLWYGMPAYARDGKVVCFFQSGQKFKTRYATLGFSDKADLDDGAMWPTAFALKDISPAEEARIAALVRKAVS